MRDERIQELQAEIDRKNQQMITKNDQIQQLQSALEAANGRVQQLQKV